MTTLSAMIAEIEDDLERSDTTAIRTKVQGAIRHYQPTRFWFNESRSTTFNTVAAQSDYAFTTGITAFFYTVDGVFLTQGTNIIELRPASYLELESLLGGASTSALPILHAYAHETLRLYPKPDAIYSVRVTGHIKVNGPATDGEASNPWMVDAYDLIKARAKAELFAHRYMEPDDAQVMRIAEDEALGHLLKTTAAKVGTGVIRSTQF